MAKRILYSVTATLPDEPTAVEYIAWLEDGHVDQVVEAGAHSGMIIRIEGAPIRVRTQYVFSTRETFDRYVERDAPGLRADGLKRFPPERGITFSRDIGEIV